MNYKKIFKRETKVILYVVIALTIVVIGASYALFMQVNDDSKNQVVTAGSLDITYSDTNGNIINGDEAECLTPKGDEEGKTSGCTFSFSVANKGTLPSSYSILIYANKDTTAQNVDFSNIKYNLTKKSTPSSSTETNQNPIDITKTGTTDSNLLSSLDKKDEKSVLESAVIDVGETLQFSLHIWIKDGASEDIIGQMVNLKLDVVNEVYETTPLTDYLILKTDTTNNQISKLTHEATETTPSLIDYRFVGANPNNYICLEEDGNCTNGNTTKLFRIVGVIPTQTTSDGDYVNRVKLVNVNNTTNVESTYSKYIDNVLTFTGTTDNVTGAEALYKAERKTINSTAAATATLYKSDIELAKKDTAGWLTNNSSSTFYLKSGIYFVSGEGTQENPYKVAVPSEAKKG